MKIIIALQLCVKPKASAMGDATRLDLDWVGLCPPCNCRHYTMFLTVCEPETFWHFNHTFNSVALDAFPLLPQEDCTALFVVVFGKWEAIIVVS